MALCLFFSDCLIDDYLFVCCFFFNDFILIKSDCLIVVDTLVEALFH